MSEEMIKNCKNDIAKFGFDSQGYSNFLLSVGATKDRETALKYHNSEIDSYREGFVKKNEHSIEDSLEFDKCKIKN